MRNVFKLLGLMTAGLALVSLALITLIISVGIFFGGINPQPGSFSHEIEYTAEIHTNGTLNNTTLLLPYPEDSKFAKAINGNLTNSTVRNDINATLSTVNTSKGLMLKAEIDSFTPQPYDQNYERINESELSDGEKIGKINRTGIDKYRRYDIIVQIDYNQSLDTRNGLETEPHLRAERQPTDQCTSLGDAECFESTTEAFLSYDAENDTYMTLDVSLEGRNSWFTMGWSGNTYSQRFYTGYYEDLYYTGSQNKWATLTGREVQGDGNYRNEK